MIDFLKTNISSETKNFPYTSDTQASTAKLVLLLSLEDFLFR
jgi:hypothetical protein